MPPLPPGVTNGMTYGSNGFTYSGGEQMNSQEPGVPGEGEWGAGESPQLPPPFSYTHGLWLGIYYSDSNWMTLTVNGTLENEYYEILSKTNLNDVGWEFEVGVIGAPSITLAPSIAIAGRTNVFWQARHASLDSDGDGLPDWWELRHGLDPNSADSGNTGTPDGYKDTDGDGWTNLQEWRNGTSPTSFDTPPAPQGLSVILNTSATEATIIWEPSGGTIVGYTLERTIPGDSYVIDEFVISATASEFVDMSPPAHTNPNYPAPSYRIKARYVSSESPWSESVPVLRPAGVSAAHLIRGPEGRLYLVISALTPNIDSIRVTQINYSTFPTQTNQFTILISNFTNGIAEIEPTPLAEYWIQTIDNNGRADQFKHAGWDAGIPFIDCSKQLNENLSFLLRAADGFEPFRFQLNPPSGETFGTPYEYAYAGFYKPLEVGVFFYASLNEFLPFEENHLFRNFVYDPAHVNSSGKLTTGVGGQAYTTLVSPTFEFSPPSNPAAFESVLSAGVSQWIHFGNYFFDWDPIGIYFDGNDIFSMSSSARNIFGLSYTAARYAYPTNQLVTLNAGGHLNNATLGGTFYPHAEQPILSTIDFFFGRPNIDHLPGNTGFSVTNSTPLLIISGNSYWNVDQFGWWYGPFRLAAYAKQTILNGDTNKPAYLGQYFDKAFKVNPDGTRSTNETGILSEYGEFFPTEPGRVILTTKPDPNQSNLQGECLVYVIKLELDVNHYGTIYRTFTGPDNTSFEKPFRFWINNDHDGQVTGSDRDLSRFPDYKDLAITSQRDLEDFARLWISGMPTLPFSQGYTVLLSWRNVSGNPGINLYASIEADGGTGYLTDTNVAQGILNDFRRFSLANVNGPYEFPAGYFQNGVRKHFIFEGATAGKGELVLTVQKNGQAIAETSVWMELLDIKDMYERAHAENIDLRPPGTKTSIYRSDRHFAANADESKDLKMSNFFCYLIFFVIFNN